MQKRNLDWLIYPHAILLVWAAVFLQSLTMGSGRLAGILAKGIIAFLLINIPLGVFSLICVYKKRVGKRTVPALTTLSVLNILNGIAAWCSLILLLKKP